VRFKGRFLGDAVEKRTAAISLVSGVIVFIGAAVAFHSEPVRQYLDGASPLLRDLLNPASAMLLVSV
jgi:hypothetical protein